MHYFILGIMFYEVVKFNLKKRSNFVIIFIKFIFLKNELTLSPVKQPITCPGPLVNEKHTQTSDYFIVQIWNILHKSYQIQFYNTTKLNSLCSCGQFQCKAFISI